MVYDMRTLALEWRLARAQRPVRMGRLVRILTSLILSVLLGPLASQADNFRNVAYDAATDEIVIVVVYRGTNPDHQFSLKWGPCQTRDEGRREIAGELLDSQWQDPARNGYKKTLRFSVSDLDCRPATVTVRTAPRFVFTLELPGRPPEATKP
jgi:hypothetical protein